MRSFAHIEKKNPGSPSRGLGARFDLKAFYDVLFTEFASTKQA